MTNLLTLDDFNTDACRELLECAGLTASLAFDAVRWESRRFSTIATIAATNSP